MNKSIFLKNIFLKNKTFLEKITVKMNRRFLKINASQNNFFKK